MTNKDIHRMYHKIGLSYRLSDDVIKEIIESQYKFAKEKINKLEFNKELTEEGFDELKTNFTFKFIGKIHTNYRLVSNYIKRQIKWEQKQKK